MLKRLNIYFKEMYPILPRLGLGYLIAAEIYFIVLLNHGVTWDVIAPKAADDAQRGGSRAHSP